MSARARCRRSQCRCPATAATVNTQGAAHQWYARGRGNRSREGRAAGAQVLRNRHCTPAAAAMGVDNPRRSRWQ